MSTGDGALRCEFLICGGGPVGLLAANLLGQAGRGCVLIERRTAPEPGSRAIGVSPPSLDILAGAGLDREMVARGRPIDRARVYGAGGLDGLVGSVDFSGLPAAHPFILSLPQADTEAVLEAGLARWPTVDLRHGCELTGFELRPDGVRARASAGEGGELAIEADYLLGCDGARSLVRRLAGLDSPAKSYRPSFLMGDFAESPALRERLGGAAHLFFTPAGAVESFPLPGGRRRWIVQTAAFDPVPPPDLIRRAVLERTGLDLAADPSWTSPFGVRRQLARRHRRGRVFLLGDAAHQMSPIGGQGMNTGFADAAQLLPALIGPDAGPRALRRWESLRRRAFRTAAGRAARSMFLGALRGRLAGALRLAVFRLMLNGPLRSRVPLDYAMLTIPRPRGPKKDS